MTMIAEPTSTARCPVDHAALAGMKTARRTPSAEVAIERDAEGTYHVRSHDLVRAILRSNDTRQAGFNAEMLNNTESWMTPPVLYQDGKPHHEQRKLTARYFTPRAVRENYRDLMERYADELIGELQRAKQADLANIGFRMAVKVAGEVVGLTSSIVPGMDRRLDAFFAQDMDSTFSWHPLALLRFARNQWRLLRFFLFDVKPAIRARRRHPQDDVITHLISQNARDVEILTECVTFGAAGMATTREFISVAAWHLLEHAELRATYLALDEDARLDLLQEMLRLEPVVGQLSRRAVNDITLEHAGQPVTIPAGALIDLDVHAANVDPAIVGDNALAVCPHRPLNGDRVGPAVMSFGDGAHRCPGAYIAMQETDIFLQRLLRLPGLRIVSGPKLSWSDLTQGYELRDFVLAID